MRGWRHLQWISYRISYSHRIQKVVAPCRSCASSPAHKDLRREMRASPDRLLPTGGKRGMFLATALLVGLGDDLANLLWVIGEDKQPGIFWRDFFSG